MTTQIQGRKENENLLDRTSKVNSEGGEEGRQSRLASEGYPLKAMPAILSTFDMTAIYLTIIFFITNVTTAVSGGAATFTYFVLGGVTFFLPCVIATAQLGVIYPYEGSLYNWTHKALGGYWSFFVAFCAWFPGVLLIVSAGDIIVSYLQSMNSSWLVAPWQQGLVLVGLLIISGIIAIQPFRTVQNMVNVIICLAFVAVALVGVSGVVWLLRGYPAATSFSHPSDWSIVPKNIALFGFVAQAYLGMEVPLNMGGEIRRKKVITRHLLLGTLLVFVGYFVTTFGILAVVGPANAAGVPFSVVSTVDMALGKVFGNITTICVMAFFVMATVVYNSSYARLLFVGGIDGRLPVHVGRLNRARVPANAIFFQTIVAIIFAAIAFMGAPYLVTLGKPEDLSAEVYNVVLAASTLVWCISTAFLLINLALIYIRERAQLLARLIFPLPVLWLCIVVGTISCLLAIVDTIFYSWIPQIHDDQWRLLIGGLTFICVVIAMLGSLVASSEATWENFSK